jgi:hypothetical protein
MIFSLQKICYSFPVNGQADPVSGSGDKRRRQRVRLLSPIQAEIEGQRVALIDISTVGARVEQPFALSVGSEVELTLRLGEQSRQVCSTVSRCWLDRSAGRDAIVYAAGLDFADADEETRAAVLAIIRSVVAADLAARAGYIEGEG